MSILWGKAGEAPVCFSKPAPCPREREARPARPSLSRLCGTHHSARTCCRPVARQRRHLSPCSLEQQCQQCQPLRRGWVLGDPGRDGLWMPKCGWGSVGAEVGTLISRPRWIRVKRRRHCRRRWWHRHQWDRSWCNTIKGRQNKVERDKTVLCASTLSTGFVIEE